MVRIRGRLHDRHMDQSFNVIGFRLTVLEGRISEDMWKFHDCHEASRKLILLTFDWMYLKGTHTVKDTWQVP